MADWEKVIKGMECCEALHNGGKVQCLTKCPYFKRSDGSVDENCRGGMIYDALSLLKSKELQKVKNIIGTAVSAIGDCPICGVQLHTAFIPGQMKTKFCYNCGRAVKWND